MKILIATFHDKDGGGQTTYILSVIKSLPNHQFVVGAPKTSKLFRIISNGTYKNATAAHVSYTAKFFDFAKKAENLKNLASIIEKNNFDIIHTNASSDHRLVLKALKHLKLKKKIPVVLVKHDTFPMTIGKRIRAKYGCDRMIAVCQYTKCQLIEAGIDPNKIDVILNGTDTDYYAPATLEQRKKARESLGLKENDFVFGSVAGTTKYKGWHYLLRAIKKMNPQPNIKVVIAGLPITKETYKKEIEDQQLSDTVILPGLILNVRDIIPAFDVGFVLSDSIETISQACREMMSMAVPTLISDYSGLPENVTDNVDGWISKTSDVDDIAKKIEKIISLPKEQLELMSKNAREKALKEFTAEEFAKKTEECYFDTISNFKN